MRTYTKPSLYNPTYLPSMSKTEKISTPVKEKTSTLFFLILSFFRKSLSSSSARTSPHPSIESLATILNTLSSFRKLLTMLAEEDLSDQTDFNYQITKLWHTLRDVCNNLPLNPSSPLILNRIKFLIWQIENFSIQIESPTRQSLAENSKKEERGFCSKEFLKKLHKDFTAAPLHSTLHNWILLIDDLFKLSHQLVVEGNEKNRNPQKLL